ILYANAIQQKLLELFKADPAYVGLVAKNPFSDSWKTYCLRDKPYSLNELAKNLELSWKDANKEIKQDDAIGLGRNCFVFHTARHWAYKEVR
ncbi:replication initiation protein, partial [Acinetobacter baumannii]|uniref:replication initiation protein n=2 Tax=Moraxellaceae TaxID=468 RepID=UPI00312C7A7B